MSKILGIDLGTTNSAMAIVQAGQPKLIENKEGNRTTPSVVAVSKKGERLTGLLAKRQAITNPAYTIFSAKRLIGRKFSDASVQKDKQLLPYEIREASGGGVEIHMGNPPSGGWYRPEEVSAMVLQKLKRDAEEQLGEKITEAIITVPAYFDDSQRQATKNAGEIAGLAVKRIINEPTAAALAYGFDKKKNEKIVVYDFGGGTFDVSVLEIGDDTIEVKATGGDTHLGGDDFDHKIINYLVVEFKKESGVDISKDQLALQRLKEAAEKAKHELSSTLETEVNIPFITSGSEGPQHLLIKLSRSKLESLVEEYISRSVEITKNVVRDAHFDIKDIDEVILVGGQTRMPAMGEAVKNLFGKEPNKSINPDEVVAVGAAIQGGILQGDVKDVLLLDVTPLSFGIETLGGVFTRLIEKNTTIPTSHSQVFSTAADNQTSVEVHVLQGEREFAHDNKSLGQFILDGIPPAPRGMPQVEVTFDIDANGILNVKAKDKASNKEQSIRIEASTGLSKEEIERMKQDAAVHAEEDHKKKELIEVKNTIDGLIYTAEKSLKDAGEKAPVSVREDVAAKINEAKQAKDSDDLARIRGASDNLSASMSKIGESLRVEQNTAGEQKQSGDAPPSNDNPDVKDAEYKEGPDDKTGQ